MGRNTGWSPECLGCFAPLFTASSTESLRRWWPFPTRSSTSRKTPEDQEAVSCGFAGLARHQAILKAAGANNSCHVRIKPLSGPDGQWYRNRKLLPSIILQAVCDMWDGLGLYRTQEGFVTANSTGEHSILLQGTLSLQMAGTHASKAHSPSSLPTRGHYKVWEPSA